MAPKRTADVHLVIANGAVTAFCGYVRGTLTRVSTDLYPVTCPKCRHLKAVDDRQYKADMAKLDAIGQVVGGPGTPMICGACQEQPRRDHRCIHANGFPSQCRSRCRGLRTEIRTGYAQGGLF